MFQRFSASRSSLVDCAKAVLGHDHACSIESMPTEQVASILDHFARLFPVLAATPPPPPPVIEAPYVQAQASDASEPLDKKRKCLFIGVDLSASARSEAEADAPQTQTELLKATVQRLCLELQSPYLKKMDKAVIGIAREREKKLSEIARQYQKEFAALFDTFMNNTFGNHKGLLAKFQKSKEVPFAQQELQVTCEAFSTWVQVILQRNPKSFRLLKEAKVKKIQDMIRSRLLIHTIHRSFCTLKGKKHIESLCVQLRHLITKADFTVTQTKGLMTSVEQYARCCNKPSSPH